MVKKSYGDRQKRHKIRNWMLQELDKEMDVAINTASRERDYTEFLETLEEDETYRQNVNIYHGEIRENPTKSNGPKFLILRWLHACTSMHF